MPRGRQSTWVSCVMSVEVDGGDACGRVGKDSEAVSTPDRKSRAGPDEGVCPGGGGAARLTAGKLRGPAWVPAWVSRDARSSCRWK